MRVCKHHLHTVLTPWLSLPGTTQKSFAVRGTHIANCLHLDLVIQPYDFGISTAMRLIFANSPPESKVVEYVAPPNHSPSSSIVEDDHDVSSFSLCLFLGAYRKKVIQVTTLEWSASGDLLATGCMDGIARLWTRDGALKYALAAHSESIFSLRFDALGKRLLTGSYDKWVSVWDVNTGASDTSLLKP